MLTRKNLLAITLVAVTIPGSQGQSSANFPVVGIGPAQWLRLHAIALGTDHGPCQALLSFRDTANAIVGPSLQVNLAVGESSVLEYIPYLSSRIEVRPVVEHLSSSLSCFLTSELVDGLAGTRAYLSSVTAPPVRPPDFGFPSFVDADSEESVRIAITGVEGSLCKLRVRLRDDRGRELVAEQEVSPEAGNAQLVDWKAAGSKTRVLIDLKPSSFRSGAECLVSAELIAESTGKTTHYVPLSVADSAEPLPPSPPIRTRNAAIRPSSQLAVPAGTPIAITPPFGLPPVPFPADNPPTAETNALGRRLFYDTSLSRDRTESCASCHDPAAGFRDPRRVSQGVNGMQGERQSMSIFNVAYVKEPFWGGRATSLEDQALGPVGNPLEFAFSYHGIEQRLSADPGYVEQFTAAFGPGPVTYAKVAKCLASFERTLVSGNSPFDRFFYGGDKKALSDSAQRGLALFIDVCSNCHKMEDKQYATFSDVRFLNTGIAATAFDQLSDQGRWKVSGLERDRGAFRPPSLRNVAWHAPYMHDGSLRTLGDVVRYYARGGNKNRWLSGEMPLGAPPGALGFVDDLVNFLNSLTGELPPNAGPVEQLR